MSNRFHFITKILSKIDDEIIDKNTEKRARLMARISKRSSARKLWIPILSVAACFLLIFGTVFGWLIGGGGKQVPVYQGMTVSSTNPALALNAGGDFSRVDILSSFPTVLENGGVPTVEQPDAELEAAIESTLSVEGAVNTIYYAQPNAPVYITVHINNPDQFEILSFTLNGQKYTSYMFEEGSDLENLILKVEIGDIGGIVEYTIDAIKYVDGEEIKDVRMEGDKTVRIGVATVNQPVATVSNETVGFDEVSFDVNIGDELELIRLSDGKTYAMLYDGEAIVAMEEIASEGDSSVIFDGLHSGKSYLYLIVSYYDDLDGSGADAHVLYQNEITTPTIVMIESLIPNKTGFRVSFVWSDETAEKTLLSLTLVADGGKQTVLPVTATVVDGLRSNTRYTLIATYANGDRVETIERTFQTLPKITPSITLVNTTQTTTSLAFGLTHVDPDGIGKVTKVELLHGDNEPIDLGVLSAYVVDGLLSDNTYTVKVTYTYDLNDGKGEHTETYTQDMKTKAKTVPTLTIGEPERTQTSIAFGYSVDDPDAIFEMRSIELLKNGSVVKTSSDLSAPRFTGLESYVKYTVKISYCYDLNDGQGSHVETLMREWYTAPAFELTGIVCRSQSIIVGDTAYFDISLQNPSGLTPLSVILNGKSYPVDTTITTPTRLYVAVLIDDSFEGGNTAFALESVEFQGDGEKWVYAPTADNTVVCYVQRPFVIHDVLFVDANNQPPVDVTRSEETVYLLIKVDNSMGYEVSNIELMEYSLYGQPGVWDYTFVEQTSDYIKLSLGSWSGWRYCKLVEITYANEYVGTVTLRLYDSEEEKYFTDMLFGTVGDVIEVRTVDDLKNMDQSCGHYRLMNDIDLSTVNISNLGDFQGYLDGNGHTISGYTLIQNLHGESASIGLFSTIGGVVKNLNVTDVLIRISSDGKVFAGCLSGGTSDSLLFKNVTCSGSISVTAPEDGAMVGSVIGKLGNGLNGSIEADSIVIFDGCTVEVNGASEYIGELSFGFSGEIIIR
ncbi:MAG: hypothetical protein IJW49_06065 [Clostridia bacterium]|nr:hypothetical protein [Clostridia bacterium]